MTPGHVSALRVLGLIVVVLGGALVLVALIGFVSVQSVDEHCPPGAICDGKGLLSVVAIMIGAGGAVIAGLGGLLLAVARLKGKGMRVLQPPPEA